MKTTTMGTAQKVEANTVLAYETERLCTLCGRELPARTSRAGRPQERHADCRKIGQLMGWLEDLMTGGEVAFTEEAAQRFRSNLFYMANTIPKGSAGK